MSEPDAPAFAVLDAFDGLFSLSSRDATLDGAVPMRVAQACVPFLEGNAVGFQVVLRGRLAIERGALGGLRVIDVGDTKHAALAKGAMARLLARGWVTAGSRWSRAYAENGAFASDSIVWLWTGLLLKPAADAVLRIGSTANRRSERYEISPAIASDPSRWAPLVLGVLPRFPRGERRIFLEGEIATVAVLPPAVTFAERALDESRDLADAHVEFYDAAYFAHKKKTPTRKYRKLVRTVPNEADDADVASTTCEIVPLAQGEHRVRIERHALSFDAPTPRAHTHGRGAASIEFMPLLPFQASWDGSLMTLRYDEALLAKAAKRLEASFSSAFGSGFVPDHRGAIWYLTKYFTPHPRGEPHFFVKPWAFVRTPPGWSSWIEGCHGDGYDVMRGVVATDVFHAAPIVFHVRRAGTISIDEKTPLMQIFPMQRSLAARGFRVAAWSEP